MTALLLAALLSAQQLEDQGRDLMEVHQFQSALEKLEAANRVESTPERLLAIAQCHRELAYASAHQAAVKLKDRQSIAAMARTLDELRAGPAAPLPETPMPEAAVAPRTRIELSMPAVEPVRPKTHPKWAVATAAGAAALFAGSVVAYLHANSLASGLSDPNTPNKPGIVGQVSAFQTASNAMAGAGLLLTAATAALLVVRF